MARSARSGEQRARVVGNAFEGAAPDALIEAGRERTEPLDRVAVVLSKSRRPIVDRLTPIRVLMPV
jgi:hypothetical protein